MLELTQTDAHAIQTYMALVAYESVNDDKNSVSWGVTSEAPAFETTENPIETATPARASDLRGEGSGSSWRFFLWWWW